MAFKTGGPGGGLSVVTCDHLDCPERFNSYSIPSIVREQAAAARWRVAIKAGRGEPLRDLCPKHKNPPRMSKDGVGKWIAETRGR